MSKLQKTKQIINFIGLALIALAVLTNPVSNQVAIELIETGLVYLSRELGVYFTVAAAIYIVGDRLYSIWATRDKNHIPSKTDKVERLGKFLLQ